jgi:Mor family transcriptional regulator
MIGYRDQGAEYVTKDTKFTSDLNQMYKDVKQFDTASGGDVPEAVREGLEKLLDMKWSKRGASSMRIAILVGDAPPHGLVKGDGASQKKELKKLMGKLKAKKVKVCAVLCESGKEKYKKYEDAAREFMEDLAEETGGQAVALNKGELLADYIEAKVKTDIRQSCVEWQIQKMASGIKKGTDEEKAKRIAKVFKKANVKMPMLAIDGTETSVTGGGASSSEKSASSASATTKIDGSVSATAKEFFGWKDILKIIRRGKTGTTTDTGTSDGTGRTGKKGTSDGTGRTGKTGTSTSRRSKARSSDTD